MTDKQTHLRYWMWSADKVGVHGHPQDVMSELGITYKKGVPQSIADQWWFIDCDNIPDELPPYLEVLNINLDNYPEYKINKND